MGFLDKNKKNILNEFVLFVKNELKIKKVPKIFIKNNRDGLKTTANYVFDKEINVCGKNRAIVDILRSVAHEMVHHKQYENGELKTKPDDIYSDIEDQAHAIAGQLIKKYALINKDIYDL